MLATRVRDKLLVLIVPSTFVAVTPWHNLDGYNAVKFLVLVTLSSTTFALSSSNFLSELLRGESRNIQRASLFAITLIMFSLLVNRYSFDERLFGISGRSLGAITLVSMFLILISAVLTSSPNVNLITSLLMLTLTIISCYFTIQLFGLDPASWEDVYGGIPSSTLGNPNFISSSLAILSTPIISLLFYKTRLRYWGKLGAFTIICVVNFLIWKTQSVQGSVIFIICFLALLSIRLNELFEFRFNRLLKAVSIISIGSIPLVTLLISLGLPMQTGSPTVLARSDYWRAAANLIVSNPYIGKGLDSFGDWYNFYRDQRAIDRNLDLFTDSVHNLILELGVFGGVALLLTYLVIQTLTFRKALTIITSSGNAQWKAIVVAWLGFHLQSSISPSSIALLSLGFFLSGIVYRTGLNLERELVHKKNKEAAKHQDLPHRSLSKKITTLVSIGIALSGICLSAVPIVKDSQFRDAIEQGDGGKLMEISRKWPYVDQQSRSTAMVLKENGYNRLALEMARTVTQENPYNFRGWKLILEYSTSTVERSKALSRLRELDPLNPNFRSQVP